MPPTLNDYCNNRAIAGTYENQLLYRMCAADIDHADTYISSGKIIAIGRIYAASPERGAGKAPAEGSAVHQAIAEQLKSKELDRKIKSIDFEKKICNPDILTQVVEAHTFLVDEIVKAIEKWRVDNKYHTKPAPRRHTSFASKYLHFHRPNAFPIMDSLAKTGLRCAGQSKTFRDYKHFCEVFLIHANQRGRDWAPRSVDTCLVKRGRIHAGTKKNNVCDICELCQT